MAKDKRTKRRGVPPVFTIEQAVSLAEQVYKRAGSQPITYDDLALIIGNVKKSSVFILKVAALRAYGLLAKGESDTTTLGDLAVRLFSALSEDDEKQARLDIFRSLPAFAALHTAFAGQVLPGTKYLVKVLEAQSDISPDFYEDWAKRFESEGRYVGLIQNDPKGRPTVRRTVGAGTSAATEKKPDPENNNDKTIIPLPGTSSFKKPEEEEFKIPTPSGVIRLNVPKDCAVEDLEVTRGLLDLLIKRRGKASTEI